MLFDWTPERVEILRGHVKDGWSAKQSGRAFGITRNAALGKASRLGLKFHSGNGSHDAVVTAKVREIKRAHQNAPPKPPVAPRRAEVVYLAPPPRKIDIGPVAALTLGELGRGQCKWPLEEPPIAPGNMDQQLFCGRPRQLGRPYCSYHQAAAWRVQDNRERKRLRDTFRRFG